LNKNQKTNKLQLSWLNAILHLTAIIANKKRFLFSSNVLNTFQGILTIVVLEGVLAIMSFPLYFMEMPEDFSVQNIFNVQFRVRKILTLGMVVLILLSFVLKVALVIYMSFFGGANIALCEGLFPALDMIMMCGSVSLMGIGFLMLFITT
jgi:hypothetical protein